MIRNRPDSSIDEPDTAPEEGLLRRWSRRKRAVRQEHDHDPGTSPPQEHDQEAASGEAREPDPPPLPPLESLDAESDYSGFMHPKVSESLRRAALRRLFSSAKFNHVDGLDDYAEDYRSFEALGEVLTADRRHQLERAEKHQQSAEARPSPDHEPMTGTESASREEEPPEAPELTGDNETTDELDHPPGETG